MSKFKVGDKVKVRSWGDMEREFGTFPSGTIKAKNGFVADMGKYCGKVVTIASVSLLGYRIKEDGGSWYYSDDMFENPSHAVIIYREGNKVIALDKGTGRKAEAICNPQDEFDFYFGADLAFERLMNGDTPKEKKPEVKYYTGEIFCIESDGPLFTKGKIYKVEDGVLYDNVSPWDRKFNSFKEIVKSIRQSKFIEVKK